MNIAIVVDSAKREHHIECDMLVVDADMLKVIRDLRTPTRNRVEIVAFFTKPISAKLKNPPET